MSNSTDGQRTGKLLSDTLRGLRRGVEAGLPAAEEVRAALDVFEAAKNSDLPDLGRDLNEAVERIYQPIRRREHYLKELPDDGGQRYAIIREAGEKLRALVADHGMSEENARLHLLRIAQAIHLQRAKTRGGNGPYGWLSALGVVDQTLSGALASAAPK